MVKVYVLFLQTNKIQKPLYIFSLIPPKLDSLRHPNTYSVMRCRNDYLKNSFIPDVVREWNKLSTEIRNSTSYQQFRKSLLSFINPTCSSLFSIIVKLLVRLRLGFSHLREHKFRYKLHDTLLCSCSLEPSIIVQSIIRYIIATKRFDDSLYWSKLHARYTYNIYLFIHNSCILTTCYMWCENEIYFSQFDIIIIA